jgi:hypothetical protein
MTLTRPGRSTNDVPTVPHAATNWCRARFIAARLGDRRAPLQRVYGNSVIIVLRGLLGTPITA